MTKEEIRKSLERIRNNSKEDFYKIIKRIEELEKE